MQGLAQNDFDLGIRKCSVSSLRGSVPSHSLRTSFPANVPIPNLLLRMHAFQKPVRWHLATHAFGVGFAINRGADGGELQTDADVVEKAGRLLRIRPALSFAGDEIFEIRRAQPEWMLDVDFMGMGRPFLDNIDRIVRGMPSSP